VEGVVVTPEERAAGIVLLVLDVDGVFTDGGLYYDAKGNVTKRFDVQDGLGVKLAQAAGLEIAVITGLDHTSVRLRMAELGVREFHSGILRKWPLLEEIMARRGVGPEAVAYMGDDWVDASIMRRVGLSLAPANAQPEVLETAHWTASRSGGHGAVREAVRFLLRSRGVLEEMWECWSQLGAESDEKADKGTC
jgi:3-deoxy-D-manno-octulosonate 8-phosphate phosphatase (KDO 8-P phosphatase)